MHSYVVINNTSNDDNNSNGNPLLNDKFLVSFDKPLLPLSDQRSEKHVNAGLFLYNLCITLLCCALDIVLLIKVANYNTWCPILAYAFIELSIAFSCIGIVICCMDILLAFLAVSKGKKITTPIYFLSILRICLLTARNILLILLIIPIYYIIPKYYIISKSYENFCREQYHWSYGIICIQVAFYVLSIIVKSGVKIFGRQI